VAGEEDMTSVVTLLFFALLIVGAPIYLTMGVSAAVMFAATDSLLPFAQKLIDEMNSATLLAVPYFVIAATFMERGGVARALIDAAAGWVGRLPGGLGLVAVLACTVFAAMCGSSVATAIAMGTILVPAMLRAGYGRGFASGIVGASGTLGILIPPSLAFVVYGVLADISIPRLFLAGVVPGLMQAALLAIYILWYSRRAGYALAADIPLRDKLRRTWNAIPALSVPVIVLGGLYGGIVTLTESAALSAVVAIVLSLFVYRGIRPVDIIPAMAGAVRNAAVIMIIIAVALAFGHWVTETGLTSRAVMLIQAWHVQGWQFLLAINILLLILGMFLEVYSVMLLIVPVVVPLLGPLHIDPIHFGVVLTINMEIALLTPPVGLNLFVIANISKTPLTEVVRGTMPFVVLMLGLLALITYVPIFSLWLPALMLTK
jgi:C4-dicarboxylate transporter, DctM subunit